MHHKHRKGNTVADAEVQCLRLNQAGIWHRDLLMLGTGGKGRGLECARATAALENTAKPDMILINSMSAFQGTELNTDIQKGVFKPATEKEILEEEAELLKNLDLPDSWFWAMHPLDSVKIQGWIARDKPRMLASLEKGIAVSERFGISRVSRTGTL